MESHHVGPAIPDEHVGVLVAASFGLDDLPPAIIFHQEKHRPGGVLVRRKVLVPQEFTGGAVDVMLADVVILCGEVYFAPRHPGVTNTLFAVFFIGRESVAAPHDPCRMGGDLIAELVQIPFDPVLHHTGHRDDLARYVAIKILPAFVDAEICDAVVLDRDDNDPLLVDESPFPALLHRRQAFIEVSSVVKDGVGQKDLVIGVRRRGHCNNACDSQHRRRQYQSQYSFHLRFSSSVVFFVPAAGPGGDLFSQAPACFAFRKATKKRRVRILNPYTAPQRVQTQTNYRNLPAPLVFSGAKQYNGSCGLRRKPLCMEVASPYTGGGVVRTRRSPSHRFFVP